MMMMMLLLLIDYDENACDAPPCSLLHTKESRVLINDQGHGEGRIKMMMLLLMLGCKGKVRNQR